jgi:hypothetical membrane protein
MADGRSGGYLAIAGSATFVVTVIALHVLQPDLSPRDEAVSYYVHGPFGWLLTVGLIGLGIGSGGLVAGLGRTLRGRRSSIGRWLVSVWAVGVTLGGVFPADQRGHWNQPPSLAGLIHGNAAMLAFFALPIGALLLGRSFLDDQEWRPRARLLFWLALAAALSLAAFMVSLAPVFIRPGPPILLGATERLLLAVYVAWLAAVGFCLLVSSDRGDQGPG